MKLAHGKQPSVVALVVKVKNKGLTMENKLYENPEIQLLIEEVKNFFLTTSIDKIQDIYANINLDDLEWFYAKNTSYLDYKELRNELFKIKYKIYPSKKFDSIISALEKGLDCSGLFDNKQIIHLQGSSNDISC